MDNSIKNYDDAIEQCLCLIINGNNLIKQYPDAKYILQYKQ